MLPAIVAALAWAPALVGLGALVRWPGDPDTRPGVAGLLGLVIAGAAGAAVNLLLPVGPLVSAGVWVLGTLAFVLRRRWITEGLRVPEVAAALAILVAASWLTRAPHFQYDTLYYHDQAIAWARAGALRPGIANVHFRLGFNSLWTTTAAVVDVPFAAGKSSYFLNHLPILFAAQVALVGLRRVLGGERSLSSLLLAGAVLPEASATFGLGGLYVDYTAALYVYVALALWARAFEAADGFGPFATAPALLSFAAPLLKLSAAPILAACALALVFRRSALDRRAWATFGSFAAATGAPWLLRGVLTSGCVAFPAWASCFAGAPWTVPEAKARWVENAIVSFARIPGSADVLGWRWLGPWWDRVVEDYPECYVLLGIAGAGTMAWLVSRRRAPMAAWVVLATSTGGVAFWFLSAPDPRFALGFLYALALTPAFVVLASTGGARPGFLGAGIVGALLLTGAGLAAALDGHTRTGTTFGFPPWRPPLLEWPVGPTFDVEPHPTRSGVTVLVPAKGELCGSAPVPCTPPAEFDPRLRYDGYFHVDGP